MFGKVETKYARVTEVNLGKETETWVVTVNLPRPTDFTITSAQHEAMKACAGPIFHRLSAYERAAGALDVALRLIIQNERVVAFGDPCSDKIIPLSNKDGKEVELAKIDFSRPTNLPKPKP